jgi:hypothetical protein
MRQQAIITLNPGTPINVGTTLRALYGGFRIIADRIIAQMLKGGSGVGYIMDMTSYPPGTAPVKTTSGHLTAQLAAATATAPGDAYIDRMNDWDGGGIDLDLFWVDGDQADKINFSANVKV